MASEQSPEAQQKLEQFFHHGKAEHPPTDTEMGKPPAQRSSDIRQAEHKEKRMEENQQNPLMQPLERRVKDAEKQADQYGREMHVPQTYPQTLIADQNPFGASGDSSVGKEPRED
ncbi:unnamed protein product [Calypogeia fissa]